jgi:hypothetical protein
LEAYHLEILERIKATVIEPLIQMIKKSGFEFSSFMKKIQ